MKAIIVGAGASIEECLRSGNSSPLMFPTLKNFAETMWSDWRPEPFLSSYVASLVDGSATSDDPLTIFLRLENAGATNVERFFEYCWEHRSLYDPMAWNDMLYGCFALPITTIMGQKLFDNGRGWRNFRAAESVIKTLHVGDLVISLNYDIIFDIAIERSGKKFGYLPMDGHEQTVLLAKPHGSIHMLVNEREGSFAFAQPTSWGGGTHAGEANLSASILPPRLNKSYRDVPIARLIVEAASRYKPSSLSFWGVGFTDSDLDLNELYRKLANTTRKIELINPDSTRTGVLERF